MTERKTLPQRRQIETIKFTHMNIGYLASIGYYADGSPGEIFIDSKKQGTDVSDLGKDAAVILSLALQHGTPIAELRSAVGRNETGTPVSIIGAVLDALNGESNEQ